MKKIYEKLKGVVESKVLLGFLFGLGVMIVLISVFSAGVSVGFRKASFGRSWGDNYQRNFGMMQEPQGFGKDNFPNAHGVIGKIIKIELPTLIVADKDGTEKVVLIKDDSKIKKMSEDIKVSFLKLDDFIVVIGSPDDKGQIEAKFIRIMPEPDFLINNNQNQNENIPR